MPTEIEKIAEAARLGVKIREDSWDSNTKKYEIDDIYDAFVQALKSLDMDVRYARLIDLANYWCNDLDDWCEEILLKGESPPERLTK